MNILTRYILFLLTIVFFTTTVGLNVFAHFCKQDGTSISYLIPEKHACEKKQEVPSCCHKEEKRDKSFEEKCCSEQVWSYKLSSELDHSIKQFLPVLVVPTIKFNYFVPEYHFNRVFKTVNDYLPPPKKGKTILIAHQVFRI